MKTPFLAGAAWVLFGGAGALIASPSAAVSTTNALGLRILNSLPVTAANQCISPYSITAALAMTYPGSAGETRRQMQQALAFPSDPAELAASFRALDATFPAPDQENPLTLRRANRLFGQRGFEFRPAFLSLIEADFAAPLESIDFAANPPEAAGYINLWVARQTNDKIQYLIPSDAISEDTTLVLVNALYLQAGWLNPFEPDQTGAMSFRLPDGISAEVETMQRTGQFGYRKLDGAQAIAIPYQGGKLQFLILLPDGELDPWKTQLNPDSFLNCINLDKKELNLFLPKFRLSPPTLPLADVLKEFGMTTAFDQPLGSADFDAMAPRRPSDYLYLSNVFHKVFLELDERGTEAAAATAVVMMRMTAMLPAEEEALEVRVDRPFLFAIQDTETGACLFLGVIRNPQAN